MATKQTATIERGMLIPAPSTPVPAMFNIATNPVQWASLDADFKRTTAYTFVKQLLNASDVFNPLIGRSQTPDSRAIEGPRIAAASLCAAIDDAIRDAVEEGDPRPSDTAICAARKLAGEIAALRIASPAVHVTRDSGIEFDFRGKKTRSGVLLICEPDGSGLCIFDIAGSRGRLRFAEVRDMLALGGETPLRRLADV
ncbi:MAG: hypothetical protein ACREER_05000 [Alphaproteobacteria bacterium]